MWEKVVHKVKVVIAMAGYYRDVVEESLKREREEPARPKRSREDLAFHPPVLELQDSPPNPLGRTILLTIGAVFTLALGWSVIGEMDIIATAQGRVIPSGKVKVIQPFETGEVRAIHVRDGQSVTAGEVLVELDPTGAAADQDRLARELATAEVTVARLNALLEADPLKAYAPPPGLPADLVRLHGKHLETELRERDARHAALVSDIAQQTAVIKGTYSEIKGLQRSLPNIRDLVSSKRGLSEKQLFARTAFLELEQQLFDAEKQLETNQAKLEEQQAMLASLNAKLKQLDAEDRRGVLDRLTEATQQADTARQDLIKAAERNRRQTLTAPVDGVVQQLAIHTVGGIVTPAQELMTIVPNTEQVEIEALLMNKDIGFVLEGQDAAVKVDSFPFTKYGTLDGQVTTVFEDAIQDENLGWVYPARLKLADARIQIEDRMVPLTPGMTVTVEIKTGKRRLIAYLLAPLQEYQSTSLRER